MGTAMHPSQVLFSIIVACSSSAALQNVSLPHIPASPPKNAASLDRSLFSFSIEFAYLNVFGGNDSAPNELTRRLMSQLEQRTGVGPDVRPGGITIDSSIFNPNGPALNLSMSSSGGIYRTTYGPELFEALNVFPQSSKFVSTVNLGNGTIGIARDEAAAAIKRIGLDRIRAFELGNEADHYGGGSRPPGWSSADYTATFLGWTAFLKQNLSLPNEAFQAGSFAEDPIHGYDFTTANIIAEGVLDSNEVKLFNQHMYQYSTCDPTRNAIATLPNLVSHTNITSYINEFVPQVQAANKARKDFVVGEFSSVSCSGKENVTDTYGQALWLADTMLYGASVNIKRMYLHQGATLVFQSSNQANAPGFSWYDLWYPIPTDRYGSARASPSFVSALLVAETVGSSTDAKIASIPVPDAPDLGAYAVWEGGKLSRIAILNLGHRNVSSAPDTASIAIDLSGVITRNATIKRMTGPGMDSKDTNGTLWAGQSFTDGTAAGVLTIEKLSPAIAIGNMHQRRRGTEAGAAPSVSAAGTLQALGDGTAAGVLRAEASDSEGDSVVVVNGSEGIVVFL